MTSNDPPSGKNTAPGPPHPPTARGESVQARLAEIDGAACVHALCATATCRACADACPRQALILTDDALGIDESACDGCGLCRPACPEQAISLPSVRFDPLLDQRAGVALLACERADVKGRGVVPCLHALTAGDLEPLPGLGVSALHTTSADCAACPRNMGQSAQLTIQVWSAIRQSRAQPAVKLSQIDATAWTRAQARALAEHNDIDPKRRGLFQGLLRTPAQPNAKQAAATAASAAAALTAFAPQIEAKTCSGCDACVRICPHDALALQRSDSALSYVVNPERCTGCRLCVDVCEPAAISIRRLAPSALVTVPLFETRCLKCGTPFHGPDLGAPAPSVCRICRQTNHAGRLFQVLP